MPIEVEWSTLRIANSRRGAGLIDVMLTIFLLGVVGLIFSATFPTAFSCSKQAQEYKVATAIAEQKMEEMRGISYESMTQPLLINRGTIDASSSTTAYSFTEVNHVDTQLPQGAGVLYVTELAGDVKKLEITVSWTGASADKRRSVRLTTLVADKRTRAAS